MIRNVPPSGDTQLDDYKLPRQRLSAMGKSVPEAFAYVLRHTFLRKLAEKNGVQYAKEASGHQSDRYIWRYVKPDRQTLADAIDELE